jgi:hypothetical protein
VAGRAPITAPVTNMAYFILFLFLAILLGLVQRKSDHSGQATVKNIFEGREVLGRSNICKQFCKKSSSSQESEAVFSLLSDLSAIINVHVGLLRPNDKVQDYIPRAEYLDAGGSISDVHELVDMLSKGKNVDCRQFEGTTLFELVQFLIDS